MKSIGVKGDVSVRTAASASPPSSSVAVRRSPVARLPIWSWFWFATTRRCAGIRSVSSGRPCTRPRNDDQVPSWKKPRVITLARAPSDAKSS